MTCCNRNTEPRKEVAIQLNREQLLYDIKNYAYIEGHIMEGDAEHARHMTIDVGDTGNVDRVTRTLDKAHASVVEMLYPYTKETGCGCDSVFENNLAEKRAYYIMLHVPRSMSHTTIRLLTKLIHEYMVALAVSDWLSITNPPVSVKWREKADEMKAEINSVKNHRTGPIRRRLSPSW